MAKTGCDCHDVLTLFGDVASESVLAEGSLFLASQMTTNSAATPGHWGQPEALLQSQDEEEREVGDRQ